MLNASLLLMHPFDQNALHQGNYKLQLVANHRINLLQQEQESFMMHLFTEVGLPVLT